MDAFERRIFLYNLGRLLGYPDPQGFRLVRARHGEQLAHVLDGRGTIVRMRVENDGLVWAREIAPGLWRPLDRH